MNTQKGGLKLKPEYVSKYEYDHIGFGPYGFGPVLDMINSPSANLQLLTYKSLKGFMIVLTTSSDDSVYLKLKNNKFNEPVTSFILKFAVITKSNNEPVNLFKGVKKMSESKASFFSEAKLQQSIWKKSVIGGHPEICPSIANFSLFAQNDAILLLDCLIAKTILIPELYDIFRFLHEICNNKNAEIGIITMPEIEHSQTLYAYMNSNTVTQAAKEYTISYVYAQVVRLFISINVIHYMAF